MVRALRPVHEENPTDLNPITIYIDADACPVKEEVYRVAERHALKGVDIKVPRRQQQSDRRAAR